MEGRRGEVGSAIRKGQSRAAAPVEEVWGGLVRGCFLGKDRGWGGREKRWRWRWAVGIEIEVETAVTRRCQKPSNVSQQELDYGWGW
jgi:hypothetical protein